MTLGEAYWHSGVDKDHQAEENNEKSRVVGKHDSELISLVEIFSTA
jgi:hypothetical protein